MAGGEVEEEEREFLFPRLANRAPARYVLTTRTMQGALFSHARKDEEDTKNNDSEETVTYTRNWAWEMFVKKLSRYFCIIVLPISDLCRLSSPFMNACWRCIYFWVLLFRCGDDLIPLPRFCWVVYVCSAGSPAFWPCKTPLRGYCRARSKVTQWSCLLSSRWPLVTDMKSDGM